MRRLVNAHIGQANRDTDRYRADWPTESHPT